MASQRSEFIEDGFELRPGQSANLTAPAVWSLYIWGRSGCSFNSLGYGGCVTGDCGGTLRCPLGRFPNLPITMVTLSLNNNLFDTYGVYLGAGFNIPVSISPYGPGSDQCQESSCLSDVNSICPAELQVRVNNMIVACKSACLAFNRPEFCCLNTNGTNTACKPTNYTTMFEGVCPAASADGSSQNIFKCSGSQFFVSFC
ncbi:pathogenesis-related thaumatin-like protein 3.5 [Ricinus communis]|uniref:pathogenesis-related thaumatin-like protein 3.5 n=1 Tax=Ricinus communis TaxID=3988 RepID=UPI00201AC12F|nr:pathogenesis-related thaumatin-like protein 3.5 [Ricinus communis]